MLDKLAEIVGDAHVLTGSDMGRWTSDWMGSYFADPLAVVRPATTREVSELVKLANATGTPITPVSGNTGLAGGTSGKGQIMVSMERMNTVHEIRADARLAIVDAGVILSDLHNAVDAEDLVFPLTFGARGSCMIGGCLSTNAGGSNVVRYGNTRDLVLGIEVVLPTGEIADLMTELHKDNSGYNLKHLMIGAEGTLGFITKAVVKLFPKPKAYATAMVAAPSVDASLELLNRLQDATGGAVEAFEYMPRAYIERHLVVRDGAREPFDAAHDVNIMVEIGSTIATKCTPDEAGQVPLVAELETILGELFETGHVIDAVVAQNEAQRTEMWERRESAAEVVLTYQPLINLDIAVPLDRVATFLTAMHARLGTIDPGAREMNVAHLGDGNVHYTVWGHSQDPSVHDAIMEAVEDESLKLGGSFSAEHGIGVAKKKSMERRKDPVALAAMRAIKTALDPKGIMNPGKVLPDA